MDSDIEVQEWFFQKNQGIWGTNGEMMPNFAIEL